jgi:hypothetical protein
LARCETLPIGQQSLRRRLQEGNLMARMSVTESQVSSADGYRDFTAKPRTTTIATDKHP